MRFKSCFNNSPIWQTSFNGSYPLMNLNRYKKKEDVFLTKIQILMQAFTYEVNDKTCLNPHKYDIYS